MSSDADVMAFAISIGATEPATDSPDYEKWKRLFRRSNYFRLNGLFIIVKISRSKKPFWGVGKDILDFLNVLPDYRLVLLKSQTDGWAFSKAEVQSHICSRSWRLASDGQYKINVPLPDRSVFYSPQNFVKKFTIEE